MPVQVQFDAVARVPVELVEQAGRPAVATGRPVEVFPADLANAVVSADGKFVEVTPVAPAGTGKVFFSGGTGSFEFTIVPAGSIVHAVFGENAVLFRAR